MFWKLKPVSNLAAVRLLKISDFCVNTMFIVSIITLLYQDKGVSIGDFFLVQAMCSFATFLFEIPSGYLSDRFSRKKILWLGVFVCLLSYVDLFFAYGFWPVAMFEIMQGFAIALFSGTKEAYAYDLLKRDKKEKTFLKEYGSITTYAQAGGFVGAVTGASLYALMGNWMVALEGAFVCVSLICITALPDIKEVRRKVSKNTSIIKDIAGIVKMSVHHPEIKWFMIFPAIFGGFTFALMWIIQPTMQSAGVAVALFGLFVGINQFSRMIYSKCSHFVYNKLGTKHTMLYLVGGLVAALLAVLGAINTSNMWVVYALCAIIAIVPASQKMCGLVFHTLIHHRIKSTERGTVLSVNSMYATCGTGTMMVLMKILMDGVGLQQTIFVLLSLLVILLIPIYKIWRMKIK